MTHHKIELVVKGDDVLPTKIPVMKLGDTVSYFFQGAGTVIIRFPGLSPFLLTDEQDSKIVGKGDHTIVREGVFASGCQIESVDKKTTIGWNPSNPQLTKNSGGVHDVRKP